MKSLHRSLAFGYRFEIGYEVNFVSFGFFSAFLGQKFFLRKLLQQITQTRSKRDSFTFLSTQLCLFSHVFQNSSWSLHDGNVFDVHRHVVVLVDSQHKKVSFKFITNSTVSTTALCRPLMLFSRGAEHENSCAWCKECSLIIIISITIIK